MKLDRWYKRMIVPIAFLAVWAFCLTVVGGQLGFLLAVLAMLMVGAGVGYVIINPNE